MIKKCLAELLMEVFVVFEFFFSFDSPWHYTVHSFLTFASFMLWFKNDWIWLTDTLFLYHSETYDYGFSPNSSSWSEITLCQLFVLKNNGRNFICKPSHVRWFKGFWRSKLFYSTYIMNFFSISYCKLLPFLK